MPIALRWRSSLTHVTGIAGMLPAILPAGSVECWVGVVLGESCLASVGGKRVGLAAYFVFYNGQRRYPSLASPEEVYAGAA